jgi:hypothetical protein
MVNFLKEYEEVLKKVEEGKYSKEELEIMSRIVDEPDISLDYVIVSLEDTDFVIELSPNSNPRHNYAENVFHRASKNDIIAPEAVLKQVLPSFYPLISVSYKEMQNPKYRLNRNFLEKTTFDFSYPEVVLSMMSIEQSKNLRLDYNWGL